MPSIKQLVYFLFYCSDCSCYFWIEGVCLFFSKHFDTAKSIQKVHEGDNLSDIHEGDNYLIVKGAKHQIL